MLPRWLNALLVVLQEAWSARRDAKIRFLKLQVEILRSRLPGNRVIPDPLERRRLLKIGAELGHVSDLRVMSCIRAKILTLAHVVICA